MITSLRSYIHTSVLTLSYTMASLTTATKAVLICILGSWFFIISSPKSNQLEINTHHTDTTPKTALSVPHHTDTTPKTALSVPHHTDTAYMPSVSKMAPSDTWKNYYTPDIQLSYEQISTIMSTLTPNANFLVFGLGHDSKMWANAPNTHGKNTVRGR